MRLRRPTAALALAVALVGGSVAGSPAVASAAVPVAEAPAAPSEGGSRLLADRTFSSAILGRDVAYSVYLPEGYGADEGTLPVVYLLHGGAGGQHTDWALQGDIQRTLDEGIARREIPPVVVVMPDARRDPAQPAAGQQETYYVNDLDGAVRYEDMLVQEMLPGVEAAYGVGGAPERRGIAGLSMGGYGAMVLSMRYPGTFVGAAGLSVAHRTDEQIIAMDQEGWDRRHGRAYGEGLVGEARLTERYREYDLLSIIERTPVESLTSTSYWFDIGAYDDFLRGNAVLSAALADKEVPHRFQAREGEHDWAYWTSGAGPAMAFLGDLFGAPAASFADLEALVDAQERDGGLSDAGARELRSLLDEASAAAVGDDDAAAAELVRQMADQAGEVASDPVAARALTDAAGLLVTELERPTGGTTDELS